jgi:hypothetical protein
MNLGAMAELMVVMEKHLGPSPPPDSGTAFNIDSLSNLASLNGDRGVFGASVFLVSGGPPSLIYINYFTFS